MVAFRNMGDNDMSQGIELFSGGGGGTEGLMRAGVKVALAVDNCEVALAVHRLNHPTVQTLKLELGGDIRRTSRILRGCLDPTKPFHLHGSPPCQALSTASRSRGNYTGDEGLILVKWFLQLVEYMKPDSWSMENVEGVSSFLDSESVPYHRVNCAEYGVPQNRKRIIAGEGFDLTPSKGRLSFWAALPHLRQSVASEGLRIVSRRRKRGETPQFYRIDEPSHTITRIPHIIESEETGNIRSLTLEESATLQGWPSMKFPSGFTRKELMIVVGNMIPPPLFENLGGSII